MAFKMKMKSYGKGKSPIKMFGAMGAAANMASNMRAKRNAPTPNPSQDMAVEVPQNPQNPNPQNPNLQNPADAAQGAVAGAVNAMPR